MTDNQLSSVLDKLGAVKDSMTVSRVFGESYQVDGVTIVPVATVRGGGGGGGGEGTPPGGEGTGTGAGLGFGVVVRPLGVYIVKDGEVRWQPAIDMLRVVVGGQLLALAAILALRRRRKRRRGRPSAHSVAMVSSCGRGRSRSAYPPADAPDRQSGMLGACGARDRR